MDSLPDRYRPRHHHPFAFAEQRVRRSSFVHWLCLGALAVLSVVLFFMALEAASKDFSPTSSANPFKPRLAGATIPDPCGLWDVECPNERQNANKGQVLAQKMGFAPTLAKKTISG